MADQNQNTQQTPPAAGNQQKPHASVGPAIGIIIILVVIVLGGLYFWSSRISGDDEQTEALQDTSESDEVGAIEDDLDATNLGGLDSELDELGAELENL